MTFKTIALHIDAFPTDKSGTSSKPAPTMTDIKKISPAGPDHVKKSSDRAEGFGNEVRRCHKPRRPAHYRDIFSSVAL
jgi:hypothetical protein